MQTFATTTALADRKDRNREGWDLVLRATSEIPISIVRGNVRAWRQVFPTLYLATSGTKTLTSYISDHASIFKERRRYYMNRQWDFVTRFFVIDHRDTTFAFISLPYVLSE